MRNLSSVTIAKVKRSLLSSPLFLPQGCNSDQNLQLYTNFAVTADYHFLRRTAKTGKMTEELCTKSNFLEFG